LQGEYYLVLKKNGYTNKNVPVSINAEKAIRGYMDTEVILEKETTVVSPPPISNPTNL
jgi:hypothetical protein